MERATGIGGVFVRSARPDQQGKFQIKGLPAGDYLAVAIDYVEDGMWNDPEYLESVRRYGEKVRLGESGSQTVALKLLSFGPVDGAKILARLPLNVGLKILRLASPATKATLVNKLSKSKAAPYRRKLSI